MWHVEIEVGPWSASRCAREPNSTIGGCEVRGWCPIEKDIPATSVLSDVGAFTIFVRAAMNFPTMNMSTNNLHNVTNGVAYGPAKGLIFGKSLFRVSDLLAMAGASFDEVAEQGAMLQLEFTWVCDLDRDVHACAPGITAKRLDPPTDFSQGAEAFSHGPAHTIIRFDNTY